MKKKQILEQSEANGADEPTPLDALRVRAADLSWDPDHLRAFLIDLIDLLSE